MFAGKIGIPELLVVFMIALLIFGPSKLGSLGKSLGDGIRGFKSALSKDDSQPGMSSRRPGSDKA
jgi:sec-independent protein translocase protein TatA